MTRFWQRRIAALVALCGAISALLYAASFFAPSVWGLPSVGLYVVISGTLALIVGIATFVHTPPEDLNEHARFAYLVLLIFIVTVVYSSGTLTSQALPFWAIAAFLSPFFGAWGIIPALLVSLGIPAQQYLTGSATVTEAIWAAIVLTAPIVAGFFAKPIRNIAAADTDQDRSYRALASELSQATGKAEIVINAIGEGVIAVDGKGIIELVNPAALAMVGWGKEDALGLHYGSILKLTDPSGNELDSAHDPVARVFATNNATETEDHTLLTQSGKSKLVTLIISPLGQPGQGAIIVFRDVTKERAEEHQQAEFISTASHEMRTPVAAIEGYLGLVLNPQITQIDEKGREYVTKAHESAQHLGRLFQDLLDVTRVEDGRMQGTPKVIDLVKFMSDIVEGLRPQASAKGLRLVFVPELPSSTVHARGVGKTIGPSFFVNADPSHLREVAENLVENAIKYTPAGEVSVDVTGTDQSVTISIKDSGLGIPREDISHLFQKFYRVDNSDTREIGGTGLGLYLCRRLVENMNGRIWVESTYQKGSTFFVELPRISSVKAQSIIQETENTEISDPAVASNAATGSPTVLPPDEIVESIIAPEQPSPVVQPVQAPQPTFAQSNYAPAQQPAAMPAAPTSYPVVPPTPSVIQTPPTPLAVPGPDPSQATTPQYNPTPQASNGIHPNTPLTQIEQNPNYYIQQNQNRSNLSVPGRQP